MAAIPWPASLPGCAEAWEETAVPVVIRTAMDIGPPKVRRRYTRTMRHIRVQFTLTHEQAMALREFFDLDLQGGVNEHEFTHPFLNLVQSFRFVEPPSISNVGAMGCAVSCSWEQL